MFASRISAGAIEQLPGWEKPHAKTVAWSYDMEGHARKCVERYCELANKKVESSYTKFQVFAWMTINSNKKNLNQWENYHKFAQNCFEMLGLRTNRKTRHSVVGQQTCKRSHKMDSGMRQTMGKIDVIHSSHKWIPTTLSCGQHCSALSSGFIFKTQTLPATLKTRNQLLRESCVYSEAEHHQLDVQETNVSTKQFYRIWNPFLWILDCAWMGFFALDLWDMVIEVLRATDNTARHGKLAQGDLCGTSEHSISKNKTKTSTETRQREFEQLLNVDYVPTNTHSSQGESQL